MSDYLAALKADKQIARLRKSLEEWLKSKEWSLEELLQWLQGYRLPPVGYDYEVYVWMIRALLTSSKREKMEKELAIRLAGLLETRPDVSRPGDRPDEVLYNLFMLCAEIKQKKIIGPHLDEVYKRRKLNGEWHGLSLRSALRTSLIYNQTNGELKKVWRRMVLGRANKFLRGHELDGFEGALHLQKGPDSDEPDINEIGNALKAMSVYLKNELDRRPKFQSLINKVKDTYSNRKTWDMDLIYQADKQNWERWTLTCLPKLCLREKDVVFLWEDAYKNLFDKRSYDYEIVGKLCDKRILKILVKDNIDDFLNVAKQVEDVRLELPFARYSSVLGVIHHKMMEIEMNSFHRSILANAPNTKVKSEIFLKGLINQWKRDSSAPPLEVTDKSVDSAPESSNDIELPISKPVLVKNFQKARAATGSY